MKMREVECMAKHTFLILLASSFGGRDRRRPEISGQHVGTCEPNVGLGQGALRDHSDQKT